MLSLGMHLEARASAGLLPLPASCAGTCNNSRHPPSAWGTTAFCSGDARRRGRERCRSISGAATPHPGLPRRPVPTELLLLTQAAPTPRASSVEAGVGAAPLAAEAGEASEPDLSWSDTDTSSSPSPLLQVPDSDGATSASGSESESERSSSAEESRSGSGGTVGRKVNGGLKLKGSTKLRQWARNRSKVILRSSEEAARAGGRSGTSRFDTMIEREEEAPGSSGSGPAEDEGAELKEIYVVSDGTGWTADQAVQAALGQFDYCFVDGRCPVKTRLYQKIRDVEKLLEVLRLAGENRALVVSTLVEPSMNDVARTACRVMRIPHVDMLGPLLSAVEEHLGVSATRLPRGAPGRKSPLSKEYFRRIEAVDFTIKQDDGAHPRNLYKADIVLVGVSRTGKTPLSIYLAQKGYKVANVPLVPGIPPPAELLAINQNAIFALTIDASTLESIRRSRFATLGLIPDDAPKDETSKQEIHAAHRRLDEGERGSLETRIWQRRFGRVKEGREPVGGAAALEASQAKYYSLAAIKQELDQVHQLFRANPLWPVINVTGRAIEETAAEILGIHYERINKQQMPYISRRY